MRALVMVFLLGLVLATPALAQTDAEAVEAALFEMYERLNDSDATYTAFWHPEATTYARAGGLLGFARTESAAREAFDAGLEYIVTVASVDVTSFGGDAALATYYTGGLVRNPDGQSVPGGAYRASMMWVKEGDEWKIIHLHISPL